MERILIIADDITGAFDTGIQFIGQNRKINITSDISKLEGLTSESDVLIFNSNTRHLTARESYDIVYQAAFIAHSFGFEYIYKKTDSVLRGNIGSELAAVMDAACVGQLMFLPSFPKVGRVLKDGVYRVDGVPVSESSLGKDKFNPVKFSFVPDILKEQTEKAVHVFPSGTFPVDEDGICIFDSETTENMETIAKQLGIERLKVSAGCAGFAEILAEMLYPKTERTEVRTGFEKLVVLNGSMNVITSNQLTVAEQGGAVRIELSPEQKLSSEWVDSEAFENEIQKWLDLINESNLCIIDGVCRNPSEAPELYAERYNLSANEIQARIPRNLAVILRKILDAGFTGAIMCIGGDTLQEVIRIVAPNKIRLVNEIVPGVVLSEIDYDASVWPFITKSGGLGTESILHDLVKLENVG